MPVTKYPDVEFTPVPYWDLPRTRVEAIRSEGSVWFDGTMCSRGHVAPKYVTNGTCAVCMRAHVRTSIKRREQRPPVIEMGSWLTNKERRQVAADAFEKRYTPLSPCERCGCTERYVSNDYCVSCSARKRAS